jgi:alanine-synthesizing transaminase
MNEQIRSSDALHDVRYEIRGQLANRALEMEKRGYEILSLNIGNPGLFGFRTPETMRLAMIENLGQAEPYCHQKGIFPAREAVVMQQQNRDIHGVTADEVFIGNGVSGDVDNGFLPNLGDIERQINSKTRAIVVINPNNPSGAVYDRGTLAAIVELAERHKLVVLSDEIYDQMTYDDAEFVPLATLVENTVCLTFSGLSKVYRACGYRVGWCVFSGELELAADFIHGMELLSALRLCSNVPGQWAVQTALGGFQSIQDLVSPGGRLYQSRQTVIDRVAASEFLTAETPMGAMYAFLRLDPRFADKFDDQDFALDLLENHHVLVAPGSSFNTPYTDHFRITTLPDTETLNVVFDRIEACLGQNA